MGTEAFALTTPVQPAIRRVLDASTLDERDAVAWLMDPRVDTVRKACLLNILAVLCVTPTPETPLIVYVREVFAVKADRIYIVALTLLRETLATYVDEPAMPFYEDPGPVLAIHHELLAHLPPSLPVPAFRATGRDQTLLASFRAEGAPSLQIVIADSDLPYTVADIDLDAHNPLQDVVGFVGHMLELVGGRRSGALTDQIAMRARLCEGPAAGALCYTLGAA